MEKSSNALLQRWMNEELDLDNFFFSLFGCESATNFYQIYSNQIVPYLIENQKDLSILECTGKTMTSILKVNVVKKKFHSFVTETF